MNQALTNILWFFAYGLSGSVCMSIALAILIKFWAWITPIDEWEELKKGNIAVAIVMAAVIIAFGIVVSAAVHP